MPAKITSVILITAALLCTGVFGTTVGSQPQTAPPYWQRRPQQSGDGTQSMDAGSNAVEVSAQDSPMTREQYRSMRRAQRSRMRSQVLAGEGLNAHLDVSYVPGSKSYDQQLDLYLPFDPAPKPYPVIVFIHGGGWHSGDRKTRLFMPLIQRGFAVASISYRLTPGAVWPAQIYDCKAAIRYLRAHAKQYNLDPNRIGAWGDSAGAHLAALLGTSGGVKELEGNLGNTGYSSNVQAVCDWFGPTDLLTCLEQQQQLPVPPESIPQNTRNFIEWLLAGPVDQHRAAAKQASPITYVSSKAPPFFIAHGDRDTTVPMAQSRELIDALKNAKVDVTFRVVPGAGHGTAAFPHEIQNEAFNFFDAKLHNSYATSGGGARPGVSQNQ